MDEIAKEAQLASREGSLQLLQKQARLLAQPGVAQAGGKPFVVAQRGFTFEQQQRRDAADRREGADMGADPVGEPLRPRRLRV